MSPEIQVRANKLRLVPSTRDSSTFWLDAQIKLITIIKLQKQFGLARRSGTFLLDAGVPRPRDELGEANRSEAELDVVNVPERLAVWCRRRGNVPDLIKKTNIRSTCSYPPCNFTAYALYRLLAFRACTTVDSYYTFMPLIFYSG